MMKKTLLTTALALACTSASFADSSRVPFDLSEPEGINTLNQKTSTLENGFGTADTSTSKSFPAQESTTLTQTEQASEVVATDGDLTAWGLLKKTGYDAALVTGSSLYNTAMGASAATKATGALACAGFEKVSGRDDYTLTRAVYDSAAEDVKECLSNLWNKTICEHGKNLAVDICKGAWRTTCWTASKVWSSIKTAAKATKNYFFGKNPTYAI